MKQYSVNKNPEFWDSAAKRDVNYMPKVIGRTHNLNEFEIVGTMRGECVSKSPKISWRHFDFILFLNESIHPRLNKKRLKFIGLQIDKQPVLIVAKSIHKNHQN